MWLYIFPIVAHAQTATDNAKTLVLKISFYVLNPIISVMFGIAIVVFIWGVAEYFWQRDSDAARAQGVKHMTWGLVGIFVMVASFALIRIMVNSIGADIPTEFR
jgi:FtsH-binding integral membrane protein